MMLRQRYVSHLFNRSWKQVVKGEVTVKRQITNEKEGFLNAARSISYNTDVLRGCDIFILTGENKNTRVGIKILGDAAVWMEKVQASGLTSTDILVISETDYRIMKITHHDSLYGDRSRVDLERQ
jgi:hypothetical protein